MKNIKAS